MQALMRYGVLCELEVIHDYFVNSGDVIFEALGHDRHAAAYRQYSADDYIRIAPTGRTSSVLAGHKMLVKSTGRGFLIGVELDESANDDRPAIPFGPDLALVFSLQVIDPSFFNYTAIPDHTGAIFRFGNDSGNDTAGGRHLSAPVPPFDATRSYPAGDLHSEPAGNTVNLFRSIRDTGPSATPIPADWVRLPADTHDPAAAYPSGAIVLSANRLFEALVDGPGPNLNNAADWNPVGIMANQYASRADRVDARPFVFDVDVSAAAVAQATVRVFRPGQPTAIYDKTFTSAAGTLERLQVDLRYLPPGLYDLTVLDAALVAIPGFDFEYYVDSAALSRKWFGVIQIGVGSGDLALLDGTGALRSPTYSLRFLNRATRWRYLFPETQDVGAGAEVSPEDPEGRILVSDGTHPLTRYGTGLRLRADDATTPGISEQILLPEPATARIRKQNAQWYSEIQMSNYPPLT